jgi:hypothetical protein
MSSQSKILPEHNHLNTLSCLIRTAEGICPMSEEEYSWNPGRDVEQCIPYNPTPDMWNPTPRKGNDPIKAFGDYTVSSMRCRRFGAIRPSRWPICATCCPVGRRVDDSCTCFLDFETVQLLQLELTQCIVIPIRVTCRHMYSIVLASASMGDLTSSRPNTVREAARQTIHIKAPVTFDGVPQNDVSGVLDSKGNKVTGITGDRSFMMGFSSRTSVLLWRVVI